MALLCLEQEHPTHRIRVWILEILLPPLMPTISMRCPGVFCWRVSWGEGQPTPGFGRDASCIFRDPATSVVVDVDVVVYTFRLFLWFGLVAGDPAKAAKATFLLSIPGILPTFFLGSDRTGPGLWTSFGPSYSIHPSISIMASC